MILKRMRVRNLRCVQDERLECGLLTALVGPNGCGKSTFIHALDLFYSPSPRVLPEDFYAEDTSSPIEIELTFSGLSPRALQRFDAYLQGDELTIVRVFTLADGRQTGKLYGATLQNPDFRAVRSGETAAERKTRYQDLRASYGELPAYSNQTAALQALRDWESTHPERCQRQRDDGQFFGFTEVAQGYLGQFTKLIVIPAVRDAAGDALDGKGTVISQLMDAVVRTTLSQRPDFSTLRETMFSEYQRITEPSTLSELNDLQLRLTTTLQSYVPGAAVALRWLPPSQIELPMPKAEVKLLEDGFEATVARTGHGLQRSFILTMLQHLAMAGGSQRQGNDGGISEVGDGAPGAEDLPSIMLAIEEPELYQHPNRQRHLASVLMSLTSGTVPGVAHRTQIIYGTHSPLFVGLDRFEQVRRLRKVSKLVSRPKITVVASTTLERVAATIHRLLPNASGPFTGTTMEARLRTLMTPWMSEGFFADLVVLVEGEEDRAAIVAQASADGVPLESAGISVIPCMGKNNLDRPYLVFTQLGIPTYMVWDGDHGGDAANAQINQYLLRLLGRTTEEWPDFVTTNCACFRTSLGESLKSEIGLELYDSLLSEECTRLGKIKRTDAVKNPAVMSGVFEAARAAGAESSTLKNIIRQIVRLVHEPIAVTSADAGNVEALPSSIQTFSGEPARIEA